MKSHAVYLWQRQHIYHMYLNRIYIQKIFKLTKLVESQTLFRLPKRKTMVFKVDAV